LAADATNDDDNNREGGEGEEPRFPCLHCGLTLLLPEEQCPRCHKVGRRIVQIVNERMIIRDRTVRVLAGIERRYWFLIGSLAVTVCVSIIFLAIELDPYRSTVFSVIAGLVSFLLGFYGVVQVRRIYSQV
jgi:hypothetical protein